MVHYPRREKNNNKNNEAGSSIVDVQVFPASSQSIIVCSFYSSGIPSSYIYTSVHSTILKERRKKREEDTKLCIYVRTKHILLRAPGFFFSYLKKKKPTERDFRLDEWRTIHQPQMYKGYPINRAAKSLFSKQFKFSFLLQSGGERVELIERYVAENSE